MSTPLTARPSSARTFTVSGSATTYSRPSPGRWLYTPASSARSRVLLPWKPPPTTSVTPSGTPIPVRAPALGASSVTRSESGSGSGPRRSSSSGRSSIPLRRGREAPSATKATRRWSPRAVRRCSASSLVSACRTMSSVSWAEASQRRAHQVGHHDGEEAGALGAEHAAATRGQPHAEPRLDVAGLADLHGGLEDHFLAGRLHVELSAAPAAPPPGERRRAARPSARARKAAVPSARTRLRYDASGRAATAAGTTTRTRLGAAKGSPCTWSMCRVKPSKAQLPPMSL